MKKFVFCILSTFIIANEVSAQLVDGGNDVFNSGFVLITKGADLSKVEGTPYFNEDFEQGKLLIADKKPLSVLLRYDVVNERIEVKPNAQASEVYMLPNNQNTIYEFGGKRFVLDKISAGGKPVYGYFIELYDGNTFRLLKKPVASVTEPVRARTGYEKDRPAEIEIEEDYYLIEGQGPAKELELKHRKLRKDFSSARAKEFLKENKVRSEEDLIRFISFLDKEA